MSAIDLTVEREEMVENQIRVRGVRDPAVLNAMRTVPREMFIPRALREFAYADRPLPIASNQTISQPYIVGFMIAALDLNKNERVLEIGTGSGYAAAVLSQIVDEVVSVERVQELADHAAQVLKQLNYLNVEVQLGDGTQGWPARSPYDAIIVAAGGPKVPEALSRQLKIGGRMAIPVGSDTTCQELIRVTRVSEMEYKSEAIADVRFVPLIGDEGWQDFSESKAKAATRMLPAPDRS